MQRLRTLVAVVAALIAVSWSFVAIVVSLAVRGRFFVLAQLLRDRHESLLETRAELARARGEAEVAIDNPLEQRNQLWNVAFKTADRALEVNAFAQADGIEDAQARVLGIDPLHQRLIGQSITGAIGHTALGLAIRARMIELGENPVEAYCLLTGGAANVDFLSFWSRYFPVVQTTASATRSLENALWPLMESFYSVRTLQGSMDYIKAHNHYSKLWEAQGRGPLLELTAADHQRGVRLLAGFGLGPGDWFVAMHLRENRLNQPGYGRNVEVKSYLLAAQRVIDAGGFVIRIGNRTATPLPKMAGLVDYAHASDPDPWMDIYAIAAARFMIGTTSGPLNIAPNFGVPVLSTNTPEIAKAVYYPRSLCLPKLIAHGEEAPMSLAQMLDSPFAWTDAYIGEIVDQRGRNGYQWVENSPEELAAAVDEMLQDWPPEESEGQRSWRMLVEAAGSNGTARIAQSFIDRHPGLV